MLAAGMLGNACVLVLAPGESFGTLAAGWNGAGVLDNGAGPCPAIKALLPSWNAEHMPELFVSLFQYWEDHSSISLADIWVSFCWKMIPSECFSLTKLAFEG